MNKAEIERNGEWQAITAADAHLTSPGRTRCSKCHGQVHIVGNYIFGSRFQFVHRRAFSGCGRLTHGAPDRHPYPLA